MNPIEPFSGCIRSPSRSQVVEVTLPLPRRDRGVIAVPLGLLHVDEVAQEALREDLLAQRIGRERLDRLEEVARQMRRRLTGVEVGVGLHGLARLDALADSFETC